MRFSLLLNQSGFSGADLESGLEEELPDVSKAAIARHCAATMKPFERASFANSVARLWM